MNSILSRLLAIVLVIWISACARETDIFLPQDNRTGLPQDVADAPADQLLLDNRSYFTYLRTFPVDRDYGVNFPGSFGIFFPAGDWQTEDGEIVEGLITARIIVARNAGEWLLSNVSSLSDDQLLSMLGAVRIELFSENRPLHPTGNYQIELDFPLEENQASDWSLYTSEEATNNWQNIPEVISRETSIKDYETGELRPAIRFITTPNKWLLAAKPLDNPGSEVSSVLVLGPEHWNGNQLAVFAHLPTTNSILRLRPGGEVPFGFQADDIPAASEVTIYAVGIDEEDQLYFAMKDLVLETGYQETQIQPEPISLLDALNSLGLMP